MKLAYVTDHYPAGGGPVLGVLLDGLPRLGHSIEPFDGGTTYDCVLLCPTPYRTSDWGDRLNHLGDVRLAFVDWTEYGWQRSSVHSRFDCYLGFAPEVFALNPDIDACYRPVMELLRGRSFLYFSRELFKRVLYPVGYYPIDPIDCFGPKVPLASEDEFLARKHFLFVSQNDNHPHRRILADMMLVWAIRKNVPTYVVVSGTQRLSVADYHVGLSSAQASVAYDGYAISYSQPEILRRCALVRNEPSRLRPFPLGDGCVEYHCDLATFHELRLRGTDLVEVLDWLWRNPRAAYRTYCKGHEFVHKYHTPESVAGYFADRIAGHDWGTPTSWDVAPLGTDEFKAWRELQRQHCAHQGGFTVYQKRKARYRHEERLYQCSCGKMMVANELPKNVANRVLRQPVNHEID